MTDRPALTTRRQVLRTAAALAVLPAAGVRAAGAQTATPAAPATATACLETPMMSMGPYFLDGMPVRRDITEGLPGLPITLSLRIASLDGCAPIAGAAVDLWHCDAGGVYSGVDGGTGIFMRGVQVTGEDGEVTFETVYPGWYPGRTPHFHLLVRTGATETDGAMTGGEPIFVGQLYLDDALTDEVYAEPPYDARDNASRVRNDQDRIFMREPNRDRLVIPYDGIASATADAGPRIDGAPVMLIAIAPQ